MAKDNSLPYGQANNLVTVYHVNGEVLTSAQDMGPVFVPVPGLFIPVRVDGPSAPGKRVPLSPDETWLSRNIEPKIYLPAAMERAIALHGIGSVLAALEQENQQKCGIQ